MDKFQAIILDKNFNFQTYNETCSYIENALKD